MLRVYAMWNRSKRILYLLLFIYVPQVIALVIYAGVFDTSTYLSSMSRINFMCHSSLTQVTLISFHLSHQLQLFKCWIFLFAMPQRATQYSLLGGIRVCHNLFSVLCFWFLLSLKH